MRIFGKQLILVAGLFCSLGNIAYSGTSSWTGSGADSFWSNRDNWSGRISVPKKDPELLFRGLKQLNNTNNFVEGSDMKNITFDSGAGAFTLNGNGINLINSIINNTVGINQTINLDMIFQWNQMINTAAGDITVGGVISGVGSLTKSGTNMVVLAGSNTYSGATTISAGTLQVGKGGIAGTLGSGNVTNNAALVFNRSDSLTVSNAINGTGSLTKLGAGTVTLVGTNTYSGGTTISAGILQVGNGGTAGTIGSGNVTNNATLVFNRSDSMTVNNTISGSGSLTKAGAGILHLNGTNTYSGLTTVSSGELIVNGSLQSEIVVSFGAFLAGSGTVSGNALIGGTHTLGNSPGVQIFEGDLTYESGAEVIWELAKNTMMPEQPPVFDQMIINGDLRFTGLTKLTLSCDVDGGIVDWSDSFWNSGKSWLICDVAGSTYGFTNLSTTLEDWTDNDGGLLSDERSGATFSLKQEGSDIVLNYVIPEPTVINLVGIAGGFMLIIRRFNGRMATQC